MEEEKNGGLKIRDKMEMRDRKDDWEGEEN